MGRKSEIPGPLLSTYLVVQTGPASVVKVPLSEYKPPDPIEGDCLKNHEKYASS